MQICNVRRCHLHGRSAAVYLDSREFKTRTGSVRGCRHSYSQSQRQRHPSGDYLADTPVPLLQVCCVADRNTSQISSTQSSRRSYGETKGSITSSQALNASLLLHAINLSSCFASSKKLESAYWGLERTLAERQPTSTTG